MRNIAVQVVSVFVVIGAAFLPIGYVCLSASKSVRFVSLYIRVMRSAPLLVKWLKTHFAERCRGLQRAMWNDECM